MYLINEPVTSASVLNNEQVHLYSTHTLLFPHHFSISVSFFPIKLSFYPTLKYSNRITSINLTNALISLSRIYPTFRSLISLSNFMYIIFSRYLCYHIILSNFLFLAIPLSFFSFLTKSHDFIFGCPVILRRRISICKRPREIHLNL